MNGCFDESLTFDHILRKVAHPELFESCKTSNYDYSTKLEVGLMIALSCFLAVVSALLAHYFASIRD
ncbi:unnamed protein product [Clavelina lepadiformis]|uniref:Uncharacterized protein n=1 Tax=Clavelina lepadiformis TaxID=159417 RepID=A0ABP0G2E4_CLALP